jgi:hypothetical protein
MVSADATRSAQASGRAKTVTPSPFGPLVRAFVIAIAAVVATSTLADPDLWGHVRFGGDIAATGSLRSDDSYSFTSDRQWINHEWLSEWTMYRAYTLGGDTGLVLLKAALVGLMLVLALVPLRLLEPSATRAYDLAALTVIGGSLFRLQTMRPQLFGLVFWAALVAILAGCGSRPHRALFFAPIVFELWANSHGSWPLGLAALAVWAAITACRSDLTAGRRATILAIPIVSALATLINPYGVELWSFLADTIRPARSDILEWAPIYSLPYGAQLPWLISFVAGVALGIRGGRVPAATLAVLVFVAGTSFTVSRLDAFLAVAVTALLSPQLARLQPFGRSLQGSVRDLFAQPLPVRLVIVGASLVLLVSAALQVRRHAACLPLTADWLPEPEAIEFGVRERLSGWMVTWFDWGELAIWHFGPSLQVSMDGRRETVYSPGQIDAHFRFYRGDPVARDLPDRLHADYVWIPRVLPAIDHLREAGWRPVFSGPVSVILARRLADAPARSSRRDDRPRCFPGP